MRTLSSLVICLVLSLTSVAQAKALEYALSTQSMNKVLQIHIEQEILDSLGNERYFPQQSLSLPLEQEKLLNKQPEFFHVPDCLCHITTRVI
jgi:hypothetical protein